MSQCPVVSLADIVVHDECVTSIISCVRCIEPERDESTGCNEGYNMDANNKICIENYIITSYLDHTTRKCAESS